MSTACSSSNSRTTATGMRRTLHSALIILAGFLFSWGIMGILLGQIITFVPGSESRWFIVSGILVLAGLVLPRWYHRVTAVVLFGMCILAAIQSHQHAEDYRKRLSARLEQSSSR